jgi:hypothetical protein
MQRSRAGALRASSVPAAATVLHGRPRHLAGALLGPILCLVTLAGVGFRPPAAWAQEEIFVTNFTNNSVTVYARTAAGNTAPLRTLSGSATGLGFPTGLVVDSVNNELLVTNPGNDSVTVHTRTASGNTVPLRTISGGLTGLNGPFFLTFTTGADAFVTRLYQQVLGRAPDAAGLQGFLAQIQQFRSVVPTVVAFFRSPEFLSRNTSNEQFITILYRTFLNREPDPSGFSAFLTELQAGRLTRDNLVDVFLDSAEFTAQASFLPALDPVTVFVITLYVRILDRGPDQTGLQSFVAQLQQTRTVLPTVQAFLASPEFLVRNISNTEFVTLLYRVFLNRIPDPGGLAGWVALLNQGTATRNQLVLQFAASPEFQTIQRRLFP